MIRDKGGQKTHACRVQRSKSKKYWETIAKLSLKKEFFMTPREARKYWGELSTPLDGGWGLTSTWLKWIRRK